MGRKSKRKKHKRLSSSSGEDEDEDEKASKKQDSPRKHKGVKRNCDVNSQESCAKWEKSACHPVEDAPQNIRQIKKPAYRLAKTQATDQKPSKKEEERPTTESGTVPFHRGNCSSKAKDCFSGTHCPVSGCKTVGRPSSSKPLNTSNAVAAPQRTEKLSKRCSDEKSPQRTSSKPKKQPRRPSLASAEQREHTRAHSVLTKKCTPVDPPKIGKESSAIKTREPGETSEESCQQHRDNKLTAMRNLCKAAAASTIRLPFTSAKHPTSASSSKPEMKVTSTPGNVNLAPSSVAQSQSAQRTWSTASPLRFTFKIPKLIQSRPAGVAGVSVDAKTVSGSLKRSTKPSNSRASLTKSKEETEKQAHSCVDATPVPSEGQEKMPSLSGHPPPMFDVVAEPWYDEMKMVEELHLARSEKRLEVNVIQSYGELTCMDIDLPEEGAAEPHCKQPPQQDLILVLDTNILLSHLDYVKRIRSLGLGASGFPVVLIPWVVLQEMDSLKKGRGLSYSVAHLATPAISYIYNSLKSREPRLWGQSMQQAAESSNGLSPENNDDRVLQCCLQYQSLYPECALILCTNDKNLCSKAILSGVKAFSKSDLEAEFGRARRGLHLVHNTKTSLWPHVSPQVSSPTLSVNYSSLQPGPHEGTGLPPGRVDTDNKQPSDRDDAKISACVCELEDCLREVLSDVLKVEMEAAYEDLWPEIVCRKPPWTLLDVLQCFKKHWIAVFGQIVPRSTLQTVLNLINFFNSGTAVDRGSTLSAIREAKRLVKAFEKSSSQAPRTFAVVDNIVSKLQPQEDSPAGDVVMNEDCAEDKRPATPRVSRQEVWALVEGVGNDVIQKSMEAFKALGFDPHTVQFTRPTGSPAPPQDALVRLHGLSSLVSQLLHAFSSFLTSSPGSEEAQALLSIIRCPLERQIPNSRLTANDLLDCFSQTDYRERLRVGGSQLMELKAALDHCVSTANHFHDGAPPGSGGPNVCPD